MFTLEINVSNEILEEFASWYSYTQSPKNMPNTMAAVQNAAINIQSQWQDWASGKASIDGIKDNPYPSGRLAQTIKKENTNGLNWSVYSNSPQMDRIAEGQPEFDMKTKYPYGKKSRVSKAGIPYLIIPFTWSTPKFGGHNQSRMTPKIYKVMSKIEKSYVTGNTHIEENFFKEGIQRQEYSFNGSYKSDFALVDRIENYAQGMVRMLDSATNKSSYMTFRIISAKSKPGTWIRKAVEPINVVEALINNNQQAINDEVDKAIREDLGM